jgi:capsular polysaccharide export protein
MQNDYQIRANSPYRHLSEAIEETIRSFSHHADHRARLVFKVHPLDNGLEHWDRIIYRSAKQAGVGSRVELIDGGNLIKLLTHAKGVVLVNSTVGLHAMQVGCPVKTLGIAVFDIVGLTHQDTLDSFWIRPTPPDSVLINALVKALAGTIQIKGNFYTKAGLASCIPQVADRLVNATVNEPGGFVNCPPRLARARAIGVPNVDNDT